jgi:hypothetical protein
MYITRTENRSTMHFHNDYFANLSNALCLAKRGDVILLKDADHWRKIAFPYMFYSYFIGRKDIIRQD